MANHIQLANDLFEALTTYCIPRKELRMIGLIIRLSLGCQKDYAIVHPMRRFELAGVHQPDIKKTLDALIKKNVIFADLETGAYAVNVNVEAWDYERPKFNAQKYAKLVGFNLAKYSKTLYKYSRSLYQNIVTYYTEIEQDTISEYSKTLYPNAHKVSKEAALADSKDSKERQLLKTTTKAVVSRQKGNGKSRSLQNFMTYEMTKGREAAIRTQIKWGVEPREDLIDYWKVKKYDELLEHYENNKQGVDNNG